MSQVQDYEKLSLNRIVDNLPFSLYSKDSEGKYVDMNKLCFDMINQYEKVGVKGHKNESLFPQDIADKLSQNDEEALKSKHIKRFIEHACGHYWLSFKKPMLDDMGITVGLIGMALPISEEEAQLFQQDATTTTAQQIYTPSSYASNPQVNQNQSSVKPTEHADIKTKIVMETKMRMFERMLDSMVSQTTDVHENLKKTWIARQNELDSSSTPPSDLNPHE